jgi:hypothetical protein
MCGGVALARQLQTLHVWRGPKERSMSICRRVWASVALNAIGGGSLCVLVHQSGMPALPSAASCVLLALVLDWSSDGGRKFARTIALSALRNVSSLAERIDALEHAPKDGPFDPRRPSPTPDSQRSQSSSESASSEPKSE